MELQVLDVYYSVGEHHIRLNTSSKHKETETIKNFQDF